MLSSPVVLEYDYLKNSGVKGRVLDGILALVSNGLTKNIQVQASPPFLLQFSLIGLFKMFQISQFFSTKLLLLVVSLTWYSRSWSEPLTRKLFYFILFWSLFLTRKSVCTSGPWFGTSKNKQTPWDNSISFLGGISCKWWKIYTFCFHIAKCPLKICMGLIWASLVTW